MMKLKHITIAFLPFVLLFGCNANDAANERKGVDIENARYAPPNTQDSNGVRNDMNDRSRALTNNDDNNMIDNNDNNGMEVSGRAEKRLENLKEIQTAKVIVTDHTAYAAVVLNDGSKGNLSNKLEDKIADEVRTADRSVQKVYVSANPDFVQRMQGYGDRIQAGHPISGLFDEFSDTVRRVFPDAR
ncbi:YhcN/YlaJ family sporulation lipoprotein [Pseudobacillus badius]|uniref:YhcN/YlaJ family sporulation lipoprotein n=1 Tax=Bacillus badius TaxID=1455 RepID=UPI0007B04CAD|nr:YhcN/YlaJ family sporulation lipoprotein [Bacillus badius]KZO01402.1 hypothetical protein A4244_11620 [Bacillus badius]OCS89737.1 hypothetical protein A6M11_11635 [Bacillus badius]OVE51079.1 hypothetical protein B1A98_13485 [Bacillus badius]TDW01973.1 YhcN/YlaJ family sporulation lipoprotein [Bacillus badius]GLY10310.1 lipoprotein YhcN [Bacillus badius]